MRCSEDGFFLVESCQVDFEGAFTREELAPAAGETPLAKEISLIKKMFSKQSDMDMQSSTRHSCWEDIIQDRTNLLEFGHHLGMDYLLSPKAKSKETTTKKLDDKKHFRYFYEQILNSYVSDTLNGLTYSNVSVFLCNAVESSVPCIWNLKGLSETLASNLSESRKSSEILLSKEKKDVTKSSPGSSIISNSSIPSKIVILSSQTEYQYTKCSVELKD